VTDDDGGTSTEELYTRYIAENCTSGGSVQFFAAAQAGAGCSSDKVAVLAIRVPAGKTPFCFSPPQNLTQSLVQLQLCTADSASKLGGCSLSIVCKTDVQEDSDNAKLAQNRELGLGLGIAASLFVSVALLAACRKKKHGGAMEEMRTMAL
jgi:hypothetical protein